ncbi:MAG: sigma-70 family RNA polymerase sigma factor [Tepidisphaeraceae bacterium]|jgi:RNA polymerase sigma-70 factor (ECF subfamily)
MDECDSVVAQHGPAVWRTICRLLKKQEDAADCFQETFVQYVQLAARTKVDYPLALLKRIATRRAIDWIRRRAAARRKQVPLDEQYPSRDGEAWSAMAAEEFGDVLLDALKDIPPDQATAFCMTQLEQMDPGEVGAAMGIDVGYVAVLLHRARATLQGRLAKHLPPIRRRP